MGYVSNVSWQPVVILLSICKLCMIGKNDADSRSSLTISGGMILMLMDVKDGHHSSLTFT